MGFNNKQINVSTPIFVIVKYGGLGAVRHHAKWGKSTSLTYKNQWWPSRGLF